MAEFVVVGAGPAGSTLAARLAQLGHAVCLIERDRFPRRRLGESLTPGVLPLLEVTGARAAVEAVATPVRRVDVHWGAALPRDHDGERQGWIVDRGRFDAELVAHARTLGVRVLQPATVRERLLRDGRWLVRVATGDGTVELACDFVAEAGGRAAARSGRRRPDGPRTLAVYGYWRGAALPSEPRIEAGENEWFWGVPLPDETYNTLVFVDAGRVRATRSVPLAETFRGWLGQSGLLTGCREARLVSGVRAADATPFVADACVERTSMKVGDAALALDPLSSSGVQRAVQNAIAAAVVANTLVSRPRGADAAMRFYRDSLERTARQHRDWAAGFYAAAERDAPFWVARSAGAAPAEPTVPEAERVAPPAPHGALALSRAAEFVDLPCIDGEFVVVKPALQHPGLDGPVTWLGGFELPPLMAHVRPGVAPLELARAWSRRVPLRSGLAIVGWLCAKGILVPTSDARSDDSDR